MTEWQASWATPTPSFLLQGRMLKVIAAGTAHSLDRPPPDSAEVMFFWGRFSPAPGGAGMYSWCQANPRWGNLPIVGVFMPRLLYADIQPLSVSKYAISESVYLFWVYLLPLLSHSISSSYKDLFLCMFVCSLCVQVPKKARRGVRTSGTRVIGGCKPRHLGDENWTSVPWRALCVFNCGAITPAPKLTISFVASPHSGSCVCGPTNCSAKARSSSEAWQGHKEWYTLFCSSRTET